MHFAKTRDQAYKDVEHGIADWFDYFQHTAAAFPQMAVGDGTNVREFIDFVNESGLGTIGTPDDAGEQIERLVKQSNGGFGAFLQLAHDWPIPKPKNSELRTVCPARQATVPRAGPLDGRSEKPSPRRPAAARRKQHVGCGDLNGEVPTRTRRQGSRLGR